MSNLTTLLKILCDRRVTKTPIDVFRRLKSREKNGAERGIRARLSGRFFARILAVRQLLRWLGGERITRHNGRYVVNTFLPPFPSPAFDRLFTNLLSERQWPPVSAYLGITSRCPMNCGHCSIKGRGQTETAPDVWLRAIEGLHRLGVSLFGLTGGEPALCAQLPAVLNAIYSGGGEAMMFTSGVGFDEEKARELKRLGLWSVCVSLDRTRADEIDRLRNFSGAGHAAIQAILAAKNASLYTCVNCVADSNSVESKRYAALYQKAESLAVDEFRLIEPMPCGNLTDAPDAVFLTAEQRAELRRFHRAVNADRSRRTKVCAFNEVESPELFGCAGGTRHLFIDPGGNVCPCDFTPLSFGNIADEPIETIYDRMAGAFGQPRRNCMAQFQRQKIREAVTAGVPAPPETSLETVKNFPNEELPDFVHWSRASE